MVGSSVTRRAALSLGAAVPGAMLFAGQGAAQQGAVSSAPVGAAHRISLGGFDVMSLMGGASMSPDPIATYAVGADQAEFDAVSAANFLPTDTVGGSFTLTLVKTPDALLLFDTGMVKANNDAALAAAGFSATDVTHVVLTHMHPDHISGLMSGDQPNFPNAVLVASQIEADFWAANPSDAYTANVAPLIGKARMIDDGDEVVPGIRAEAAYGHTPGHLTFLVKSDGQKLLITGDTFNHFVYTVQHPEWQVRYDNDKEAAMATRMRVLKRLSDERLPIIAYHFPFPALGFIGGQEGAYRFIPASYQFGW